MRSKKINDPIVENLPFRLVYPFLDDGRSEVANMAETPPLITNGKQTNGPQVIATEMLFV